MKESMFGRIWEFLRDALSGKGLRRAVTCLAAVLVFGVTLAHVRPAGTQTNSHPTLAAEKVTAWSGDSLSVRVDAEVPAGERGRIIVLTSEGEGADLSDSYVFDRGII